MMTKWMNVNALALLIGCTACGTGDPDPAWQGVSDAGNAVSLEVLEACPDWRWIGVMDDPDGACPPPPAGCAASHLFGDPSLLAPQLRRFCLYRCPVSPVDVSALEALSGDGFRIDRDCMVVGSMPGDPDLTGIAWEASAELFYRHAGRSTLPRAGGTPVPVHLGFIDTAATRAAADRPDLVLGNSPHGFSLVNMARDLLCGVDGDETSCAAELSTQLALPYTGYDPGTLVPGSADLLRGGYLGTLGWLATAVREELEAWMARPVAARLVLNLSVAYDPVFGGLEEFPHDMPAPVQALLSALEDAACHGALIVASAGNRLYGPDFRFGPLLPGGWETRPAPDHDVCDAAYGTAPPFDPEHRPLVVAAGGVDVSGGVLGNAAQGGTPRLAAYGDHAVVEGPVRGEPTATLTGTSVSAAVLSSAAAALWYYRPGLSPGALADLLASTGDGLGIPADFCLDGNSSNPCPPPGAGVQRIRVCDALRLGCPPGVDLCPPAETFDCIFGETAVELPGVEDQLELAGRGLNCRLADFTDPGLPCPHWRLTDRVGRQWTGPQPGSDPCPNCGLKAAKVYIQLDPEFQGELDNATLTVGGYSHSIGLPRPGRLYVVDLQPLGYQPGTKVTLSFSLNQKTSVSSSLFTYPL